MNVAAIRGRVLAANLAMHGLAVTVRAPGASPLATRGIWLPPIETEGGPYPGDQQRAKPRQVLALPKNDTAATALVEVGLSAPAVPSKAADRGVLIDAPPATGGASVTWRVDELDTTHADHVRLILQRLP